MRSSFTTARKLGFLVALLALIGCSGATNVDPAPQGISQAQTGALQDSQISQDRCKDTNQDGGWNQSDDNHHDCKCKDRDWQSFGAFKNQGDKDHGDKDRGHCASPSPSPTATPTPAPSSTPTGLPGCTENATTGVNLGTDGVLATFAVLAGTTVTNTGATIVSGNLGVSPGSAVTGFPPGSVINGKEHLADAVAQQAQSDLATAYNDAAGRTAVVTVAGIGGQTLAPGVYHAAAGMSLTGTVTLDGQGRTNPVFIFQAGSTLITASSSMVALENGANWCNVFWQVGSSATLGTGTTFNGTILSLTSVTVTTGATIHGRVLARNGAVTLDDNTVDITP